MLIPFNLTVAGVGMCVGGYCHFLNLVKVETAARRGSVICLWPSSQDIQAPVPAHAVDRVAAEAAMGKVETWGPGPASLIRGFVSP